MQKKLCFGMILFLLFLSTPFLASAKTITVCKAGCDYSSIQSGIDAANSEDIILIHPGLYEENIVIDFSKFNINITGLDRKNAIIKGSIKIFTWNVNIQNLTIISDNKNEYAILVKSGPNHIISDNIIKNSDGKINNQIGILVDDGWAYIKNNHVSGFKDGIFLKGTFYDMIIIGNTITNNWHHGLFVQDIKGPRIIQNNISYNGGTGIFVNFTGNETEFFDFVEINQNHLRGNSNGTEYHGSVYGRIVQNDIIENLEYGIFLNVSESLTYTCLNNIINNKIQAFDGGWTSWNYYCSRYLEPGTIDVFTGNNNDSIGNRWSDFDEESEGCFDSNSDFSCDEPRKIGKLSSDNYPYKKTDCNRNLDCGSDVWMGKPGCSIYNPACTSWPCPSNRDICMEDRWIDFPYCNMNLVWQERGHYVCSHPGGDSFCFYAQYTQKKEECGHDSFEYSSPTQCVGNEIHTDVKANYAGCNLGIGSCYERKSDEVEIIKCGITETCKDSWCYSSVKDLIFYEPFEGYDTVDRNNGTINNSLKFIRGIKGYAADTRGKGFIKYPLKTNFNNNIGTIEFWFNMFDASTSHGFFDIGMLYGDNPNSMGIMYSTGWSLFKVLAEIRDAYTQGGISGMSQFHAVQKWNENTGKDWHYVVFSWDCTGDGLGLGRIYVDGIKGTDMQWSCEFDPTSQFFWVGRNYYYSYSNAIMDEFKIWERLKTEEEIREEYERVLTENIPRFQSQMPVSSFIEAAPGEELRFNIAVSPEFVRAGIKWYLNENEIPAFENKTVFTYTTNGAGLDKIMVELRTEYFSNFTGWEVMLRKPEKVMTKNGNGFTTTKGDIKVNDNAILIKDGSVDYEFDLSDIISEKAKYALLTIEWENTGINSESLWLAGKTNTAQVEVNGIPVKTIKPEFRCNDGYYYGHLCGKSSINIPIPISTLRPATRITISAKDGAHWKVNTLKLLVDPNPNALIANKRFFIKRNETLIKGVDYTPWLPSNSRTGPDPNIHELLPGEYDDISQYLSNEVPDYNKNGIKEMWEMVIYDMETIRKTGANTVRTYASGEWHDKNLNGLMDFSNDYEVSEMVQGDIPNWMHERILDYLVDNNMYLIMGYWVQEEDYQRDKLNRLITNETDLMVANDTLMRILDEFGPNPALISWGIGNEVNGDWNHRWFAWSVPINSYLNQLYSSIKNADPNQRPITYAKYLGESVSFKDLKADVMAPNAYIIPADNPILSSEFSIHLPPGKTYMLGEFGHIIEQAPGQWELGKQFAGGAFIEYNDVWWKGSPSDCPQCNAMGMVWANRDIKHSRYDVVQNLYGEPDLAVTDLVIMNQRTPVVHEDVIVSFTIKNIGSSTAEDVYWHVDGGQGNEKINSIPLSLDSGESAFIFAKIRYAEKGAYTITVRVDQQNMIMESDESNNIDSVQVQVDSLNSLKPEGTIGDANCDSQIDLGDPIWILNYIFVEGESGCLGNSDTNQDGNIDIGDAIWLLDILF